jgi:glycyl-tRNA synthetase alpha chain
LYLPAYDYLLKCSQTFNILDARKAVSVAERTALMGIMRNLSARIAQKYVMQTEGEDHG